MSKKVLTISIILVLAVVILGVVFGLEKREVKAPVVKNNEKIKESAEITSTTKTTTSTKETENSEIDTSNWKTYRNEEFGFEVRYPKQWNINESAPAFPDSNAIGIFIKNSENSGFYIFPKGEFDYGLGIEGVDFKLTKSTINNENVIIRSYKESTRINFSGTNMKNFRIELVYSEDKNLENILNEILKTFKFIL